MEKRRSNSGRIVPFPRQRPVRALPTILSMTSFDVQVRGSGIVGQSLALALARLGLRVALRRAPPRAAGSEDVRAYALNAASVSLLRSFKVWDSLPAEAVTVVHDMQVHGDAAGAMLEFSAWEQGVGALAWITDAAALERELAAAIKFAPHVSVVDADATVNAPLTAWCDGKASAGRDALGVSFERREHGQRAIAARLTSSRAHQGAARQWFRSPDVLALLPFDSPLPQRSYALVWSLPTVQAESMLALDDAGFAQAVAHATEGALGELQLASARQSWPLMQARASAWSGPGWVLLGDAAHVVHPLAGQGLNLGLADVAALAKVIGERETWRALGDAKLLRRYDRERLTPTWAMDQVTDGLLQLFSRADPAARELRNRGLSLLNQLTPLKRWLTARALDA